MLDEVLAGALQDGRGADAEVEAVVADGGDQVALLDLHAPHLHVLPHRPAGGTGGVVIHSVVWY